MPESEFILLKRFASNDDAEAFAEIIKQHASLVYGVCLRILEDKDKAADAVQETFLQLVRDAAEITGSLPNWLHRVATHKAINIIRTDSQRRLREEKYVADSEKIQSKGKLQIWQEISGCIDEELDQLDDLTREVLILHFFEGQTMTCIAEKFDISQPTVSRRIESGIVTLRHKLKLRGVLIPAAMLTAMLTENVVKAVPAVVMKELGKIALAGGQTAATATGTGILASLAAKAKIIATAAVIILAVGSAAIYYNSNQQSDAAVNTPSTRDLVRQSVQNQYMSETNEDNNLSELLSKYEETQEKIRTSYICKAEDNSESEIFYENLGYKKGVIYEGFRKIEIRSDSNNYCTRHKRWGDSPTSGRLSEDQVAYTDYLWNGEAHFQYSENPVPTKAIVTLTPKEQVDVKSLSNMCNVVSGGPIRGFFNGSNVTIDKELRRAESISVRSEKETIKGSDCFIIDAKTERSEFVIWIDPEHGYNIAQAVIKRNSATSLDPNAYNNPPAGVSELDLKNVVFKNIDGIWLPVECDYSVNKEFDNGNYSLENHHHKITEYLINPDHEALMSFGPNRIIENEAQVRVAGVQGITYIWRDGKVVDNDGREVNFNNLVPKSLIGKALPSLVELNVKLDSDVIENKMLLFCFFDYQQRPSRNCILELSKRVQELKAQDVEIITIQASTIEQDTLDEWVKENNTSFPVGMIEADEQKTKINWGVQSMPWLILTDKKHIVTDEGFSIAELDEKIAASEER